MENVLNVQVTVKVVLQVKLALCAKMASFSQMAFVLDVIQNVKLAIG
jgi:hypothetical protein